MLDTPRGIPSIFTKNTHLLISTRIDWFNIYFIIYSIYSIFAVVVVVVVEVLVVDVVDAD